MWSGEMARTWCSAVRVWVALAAGVAVIAGSPPQSGADEILVASAVSLREPVLVLVDAHQALHPSDRVVVSFGASSSLALQIRQGAPIDVFLSADIRLMDELIREGRIDAAHNHPLARNRLVVIRPRGSDLHVTAPADLLEPAVRRFALPSRAVPLGRYGLQWLVERGLSPQLDPRIVATEHARATLAAVAQGHADAGIVYTTDLGTSQGVEAIWVIPDDEQPLIRYGIARVNRAGESAAADGFIALARGPEGVRVLLAAGFDATLQDVSSSASKIPVGRP
jgi:molybdate transport system substrate-binding protein